MNVKSYTILLVDRKRAKIFTLLDGAVEDQMEIVNSGVPKKVKHGENTWDAQDKIFRHIEDHLHRYLVQVADKTVQYAKRHQVSALVIGSHKTLFAKLEKLLPRDLLHLEKGRFITDMKAPFNEIVRKAKTVIKRLE